MSQFWHQKSQRNVKNFLVKSESLWIFGEFKGVFQKSKMPVGGHDSTVSSYLSRGNYSNNGGRCKSDILGALHHYNGLKPKLDKFTFNDGRTRDLICLEGTIPVPYR